ncbi:MULTISPECIES: hypothetical protein [unclassified Breznakia]|uniref:hypothetical protein n=1 Tax=unclassified Breznakia TaxID=2623764 RepID=UPI002476560F|nr:MULTISPECIES: hypothetical protein [unclassified Breznakia]MDH6366685.1 hypothetical protein [Breznakia sp. PH1-1]MDH6403778.1 hypothetical protein [Breznakia sp. PF1-11]MDH6411487.1 hypothetical protein [Breznakia sp. PFB1-11]MDH6413782.1 hypothetical protein [Breznakia sp. PFB1-14]MDH6416212.1 hypothetical protein [Breznakia sp. PFB1-4]
MSKKSIFEFVEGLNVSPTYLANRDQVLQYTNEDMNLRLDNDEQVYIAVFDIPIESGIVGFQTQSLTLVFGLNTHLYHGSGSVVVGLEERDPVIRAMQSVLISSHQVLPYMKKTDKTDFYNSDNVRVYLKTEKGIFFKELSDKDNKIDKFLLGMMYHVLNAITETGGIEGSISN